MKSSDLEALADAVCSENHRICALEAQKKSVYVYIQSCLFSYQHTHRRGQQPFVALNEHSRPFIEQNKEGINWERVAQKACHT